LEMRVAPSMVLEPSGRLTLLDSAGPQDHP
jgi:hypothetical protein